MDLLMEKMLDSPGYTVEAILTALRGGILEPSVIRLCEPAFGAMLFNQFANLVIWQESHL